jgi:hypothetical protein
MSRWLVLAAFSIAPLSLGCGSSVRVGLANAPRLGGTSTVDNRVTDVVSNGDDGCGVSSVSERGVLRNRIPPCPRATSVHNISASVVQPEPHNEPNGGLVEPWVDHFYVGWPCSTRGPMSGASASPWTPSRPILTACSVP